MSDEETQDPEPMTPEQEAQRRAADCRAAILATLAKYQCSIIPVGIVEQIGSGPMTRWITETTYGVQPNPLE